MDLENLIALYLSAHRSAGRTDATIKWHRASLHQFASWLQAEGHPGNPGDWTAKLMREWILYSQTRPSSRGGSVLSDSAVNSLIRSLKAFCNWLEEEEFVERSPFSRVKVPKPPRLIKPTLSSSEIKVVLETARRQRNGLRDEAILLFILDTGARSGEVCGLRADAIDWSAGIARIFGKGRKERYVPFSAHTSKSMQRYSLRCRPEGDDEFFLSEEGFTLTRSGLYQICKRISLHSGIHVAPHKMRHTAAISYLRAGGNAFALQKLLGHTTLHTTLNYVAMSGDDLVAEHREHSPVKALLDAKKPR